jgi:hypothetical protein
MRSILVLLAWVFLHDGVDGGVELLPFGKKLGEDGGALRGKAVEALVAFFVLAPLAGEEALGFEAAQEGVEGAFVDRKALLGEGFAEGITVLLGAQGGQNAEGKAAAAEFKAEIFEGLGVHGYTV